MTARPGGPMPRIVETPSGLTHAVGLQNPGLDAGDPHGVDVETTEVG